jgi:hypothetical protein
VIGVLIAAGVAGAALLAAKSGALPIPGISAPTIYALTAADVQSIAQNYSDGRSNYVIRDTNASYTLAAAMATAIRTLRISVYTGDGFCSGVARPSGNSILAAGQTVNLGTAGVAVAGSAISGGAAFAATTIGKALPIIGSFVGLFTGVMSFISAHHAAAVKLENQILCPLIPAVNQALANAEAAMRSGKANGQQTLANVAQIVQETEQVIAQDSSSGALHAVGEEIHAISDAFSLIVEKSGI